MTNVIKSIPKKVVAMQENNFYGTIKELEMIFHPSTIAFTFARVNMEVKGWYAARVEGQRVLFVNSKYYFIEDVEGSVPQYPLRKQGQVYTNNPKIRKAIKEIVKAAKND